MVDKKVILQILHHSNKMEHGNVVRVGRDVYIYKGGVQSNPSLCLRAEDEEKCAVCGGLCSDDRPLVECDHCLRGFHMDCCEPPLRSLSTVRPSRLFLSPLSPVHTAHAHAARTGDVELSFLLARRTRETSPPRTHLV